MCVFLRLVILGDQVKVMMGASSIVGHRKNHEEALRSKDDLFSDSTVRRTQVLCDAESQIYYAATVASIYTTWGIVSEKMNRR